MNIVKQHFYLISFLSFIPFVFAQYLGFHNDFYAIIDSLILVCLNFGIFLLIVLMMRKYSSLLICLMIFTLLVYLKIVEEYYAYFQGYLSPRTFYLLDEFSLSFSNFISVYSLGVWGGGFLFGSTALNIIFKQKVILPYKYISFVFILLSALIYLLGSFHSNRHSILNPFNLTQISSTDFESENPIMFLIRSVLITDKDIVKTEEFILSRALIKGEIINMPEKYSFKNFEKLLPKYNNYKSASDMTHPFNYAPVSNKILSGGNGQNVILIVMESLRDFETGNHNAQNSLTPNLDEISLKGYRFKNSYSTSRYTIKSEQAILCSLIDMNEEVPYSKLHGKFNGNCIPKILADNGYTSYFFHGNTELFYNRNIFHKSLGFEHIIDRGKFSEKKLTDEDIIGWGVKDTVVYEKALKALSEEKNPFFAEILTLSNHQPFDWDYKGHKFDEHIQYNGDDRYKNYRKGIAYADFALGKFWEKFINSPLSKNTIVIITGDHSVPYYPKNDLSEADKFDMLFKVPLYIYTPDNVIEEVNLQRSYSHLDIAPTILSLLSINDEVAFLGRPMLGEDRTNIERPIFNFDFNSYAFRFGETSCLPIVGYCQSNDFQKCYQDERFSCKIGKVSDIELIKQSKYLINFLSLNKTIGFPRRN